jgi:sec-independent protein translocase protein TatC
MLLAVRPAKHPLSFPRNIWQASPAFPSQSSKMIKSPSQLKKADDLFEKSSMSFGEHLEALRKSLAWAFLFLGVGMAIGLPMANWVTNYIQTPLRVSLKRYYHQKTLKEIAFKTDKPVPEDFAEWIEKNERYRQDVDVDIEDLKRAMVFADGGTSDGLETSKASLSPDLDVKRMRTIPLYFPVQTATEALGMQEPFMIWLKAGFALGFVIASPGIFYSLWTFIAAGLYPHERRYVYIFLPLAVGLFLAGAALAFFVIFQYVIDFLLKFNDSMGINAAPRLTDYMSFALFLPLGFGISFQLPLAMLALERLGIFSVKQYISQWRAAVLVIAFISMILTPAEVMSMIGMCVPLIGLYFLGIGLCYWLPRKGSPHTGYDPQ